MNALVNVGRLLDAINAAGCNGVDDAAKLCQVGTVAFNKLLNGEVPRLDTLFKIAKGLNLKVSDIIIGPSKTEPRKKLYQFERKRA
jgi:hypothetical protein